ncbi:MAG: META domain-containing protein [Treponema sp.]|nr:META domain-containing protein [Treponema sp.]
MIYKKTGSTKKGQKKLYISGIILICSFLLINADDCESEYLAEQQYSMEQRARQEQAASVNRSNAKASQNQAAAGSQQGTQASTGGTGAASFGAQSGTSVSGTSGTPTGTQTPSSGAAASSDSKTGTGGTSAASGTQSKAGGTDTASEIQAGTGGTNILTQSGTTGSTGANYVTSISGKSWKLTELRFTDKTVTLNRNELSADQADFFTLTIDNERISGKAAPNRYMTSYQAEANNALTIQPIASTMMALIVSDPQRIQEPEYFQYLGKVKSWKVNQNKLELTTADAANKVLIMVFSN